MLAHAETIAASGVGFHGNGKFNTASFEAGAASVSHFPAVLFHVFTFVILTVNGRSVSPISFP